MFITFNLLAVNNGEGRGDATLQQPQQIEVNKVSIYPGISIPYPDSNILPVG